MKNVLFSLLTMTCIITANSCVDGGQEADQSNEVLPTAAQVAWAEAEVGAMFHLDVQVFEPDYKWRETRDYQPDPSVFNPKDLDTDQWISTAKAGGANYAILVAKHCSGFSLWPTKAHDYSVKSSPWRNGEGDIVRDFIESCKKYGVKPGLYASASANAYYHVDNPGLVLSGDSAEQEIYNEVVKTQLTELWSEYGDLFEIWFDGGVLPPEKGGIDVHTLVNKYQPNTIAFQGPFGYENNIRWVGNEDGVAPYPCWSRADSTTTATGMIQIKGLNGNPDGAYWCPGEADFALRQHAFQGGWFWHEGEEDKIRSLDNLMARYVESVGRNTNLLLGVVIDDRGLIPAADSIRIVEFGKEVERKFSNSLAYGSAKGPSLSLEFSQVQPVNYVVIEEDISKGERIREYSLYGMKDGNWELVSEGSSVGNKRIEVVNGSSYSGVKMEVTKMSAEPHFEINVY
ncbi:alpha-L-fucosidase [Membranihabitans marinus]|uniref:alpha-L-fucosidase n=1 Tax=Membranihabitans marinus TaxID=1227546 RepID=UPI001F016BB7|nr:alpha-L-fucosidase [Membranihabitans marinus]